MTHEVRVYTKEGKNFMDFEQSMGYFSLGKLKTFR